MTSISFSNGRKRFHTPAFRDSSDSDSEDEVPPVKLKKGDSERKIPVAFKNRLRNLVLWISALPVKDYFTMAVKAGANMLEEEDIDIEEEDVITIEEEDFVEEGPERPNPYLKRYQKCRKQALVSLRQQGRPSWDAASSCSTRQRTRDSEVSCMYDSRFDGRMPINDTTNRAITNGDYMLSSGNVSTIVSNPPTEIEILLDDQPEASAEADEIQIISEPPNLPQSSRPVRASARSATIRSSTPLPASSSQKSARSQSAYTAHEVIRLQEKEQYKLLLEKYIQGNNYNYVSKKPKQTQQRSESRDYGLPFKKDVLEQPVNTFLEKYCKPCHLVPALLPKEQEQPPVEIIIDDDDEMEIVDVKIPKKKIILPEEENCFTDAWLTALRSSVKAQTEERMKILKEQEEQLNRIKKERLLEQLKIEEPAEPEFPELTAEMEDVIEKAFIGDPEDQLRKELHRKDIDTLSGLSWLNDQVINSYFDLIVARSQGEDYPSVHYFNTFFYSSYKQKGYNAVRRWTRKMDLFSYDLIFIPIHLGVHWCLGVIDHRSKKICYYDSMGSGEEKCLDLFHDYLCLEHMDKKKEPLDPSVYTTEIMKDIPQQMNGSDCGMFTLKYAEYISRNAKLTFSQKDMQYFRRRMVYELFTGKLL